MRLAPTDPRLRLMLVTDGLADLVRIEEVVDAVLSGGVRCVQLREPRWSARHYLQACERLRPAIDAAGGLLLVNDRCDVAAVGAAHGAQIGHRSLPPEVARRAVGPHAVLGFSAHDESELGSTVGACDFATLSPVWPTSSKPDAAYLGAERAGRLTEAADLPVLWLGGVHAGTLPELADLPGEQLPLGAAVRSALMSAADPAAAARTLLSLWPV